jgi:hypothetical protein
MSGAALLARLTAQGVALERDGDRLKIRAARPLKAKVLCEIRLHKLAILELLTGGKPDSGTQSTLHTPDSETASEAEKTGSAAQSTLPVVPDSAGDELAAPRIAEKLGVSDDTIERDIDSVSPNGETDRVIGADGLLRRGGFIVPTRETMSAYAKYFAARSTSRSITGSSGPDSDSDDGELAARQAQHARILEVFPEAQPARGRRWIIEGAVYDHENAVRLAAYRCGTTTNGYPISIECGEVYDAELADAYAEQARSRGEITRAQYAYLKKCAAQKRAQGETSS